MTVDVNPAADGTDDVILYAFDSLTDAVAAAAGDVYRRYGEARESNSPTEAKLPTLDLERDLAVPAIDPDNPCPCVDLR